MDPRKNTTEYRHRRYEDDIFTPIFGIKQPSLGLWEAKGGRGAPNVVQIWRSGVKKLISRGSGDIWGPQGVLLLQQPFARVHRLVILALFSQIL